MLDAVKSISLLIASHQTMIAEALENIVSTVEGFSIATAHSLKDVRDKLAEREIDVILLDYAMPDLNGIESVRHLVKTAAPAKIVLFSDCLDRVTIFRSLEIGVSGYIPKTFGLATLTAALKLIAEGDIYVPHNFVAAAPVTHADGALARLRLTQEDVGLLRALEQGKTNKEIGQQFGMTEVRVKMLLRAIYGKLAAKNRTHVVTIAKASGLI